MSEYIKTKHLQQHNNNIIIITYLTETISGVGNYGYGYQGYQGYDQGYVTRKELVKSGLLLGAGILKGALLTTVINNINNNNAGK